MKPIQYGTIPIGNEAHKPTVFFEKVDFMQWINLHARYSNWAILLSLKHDTLPVTSLCESALVSLDIFMWWSFC